MPVISSTAQAGSVTEDGTLTASGQVTATDVDHDAVLSYSANTLSGTYGDLTLNTSTGVWGYSMTDRKSVV